ncbi:hypothetical protein CC2G_002739 [Coprinopsis cinerea AmutBmut pab1-1]|nr:hypothetical protein CC2G_002739 [Coprinopsis cinerea AmutBmut pab1-1]
MAEIGYFSNSYNYARFRDTRSEDEILADARERIRVKNEEFIRQRDAKRRAEAEALAETEAQAEGKAEAGTETEAEGKVEAGTEAEELREGVEVLVKLRGGVEVLVELREGVEVEVRAERLGSDTAKGRGDVLKSRCRSCGSTWVEREIGGGGERRGGRRTADSGGGSTSPDLKPTTTTTNTSRVPELSSHVPELSSPDSGAARLRPSSESVVLVGSRSGSESGSELGSGSGSGSGSGPEFGSGTGSGLGSESGPAAKAKPVKKDSNAWWVWNLFRTRRVRGSKVADQEEEEGEGSER